MTAWVDGREVFTSVGATGADGGRISQTFAPMPVVEPHPRSRPATPGPRCLRPREDPLRHHRDPRGHRPRRHRGTRDSEHGPVGADRRDAGMDADAPRVRRRRRADVDPPRARRPPARRHEPRQLVAGRAPGQLRVVAARAPRRGRARGLRPRLGPPLVARRHPGRHRQPDLRASARHDRRPPASTCCRRPTTTSTRPATTRGSSSRAGGRSTCPSATWARGSTTGCDRTSRRRAAGCWMYDDTAHSHLEVPYYACYEHSPSGLSTETSNPCSGTGSASPIATSSTSTSTSTPPWRPGSSPTATSTR